MAYFPRLTGLLELLADAKVTGLETLGHHTRPPSAYSTLGRPNTPAPSHLFFNGNHRV